MAVDRYSGRSYRSKRLEFRFAVAVHSPIAVHAPITVQPEFFQFPRRNVRLGISLSADFSAFSSFRRETCELTALSALIFVPFQVQEKVWRGRFFSIPCVVFSKGKERRFGEGLLGENYNRIAAGGLGGLSPRSALQHFLRPRLHRRSGLRPLQGSKQASNLYFQNFKSSKGFIRSDLNEAVPNHPANVNDSQTSGYTTGFSTIASSFVLFFILLVILPFILKNNITSNMNV